MPEQLKVLDLFSGIRSAASVSDLNEPECAPSRSARSNPIAAPSSPSTGRASHVTTTLQHSTISLPTCTPSAPDSPAKTPASDRPNGVGVLALRASELDFGERSSDWLLTYDPDFSCWKTYQVSFLPGLDVFSETWPRSGMMQSGVAFLHPRSVSPIDVTASGLLPTPAARDFRDISKGQAFLSQRSWHSPSLATRLLERGVHWTMLSEAYEAAMGYPSKHTEIELKPSETRSSRKSRKQSGEQS
jgi:hypothetical protein